MAPASENGAELSSDVGDPRFQHGAVGDINGRARCGHVQDLQLGSAVFRSRRAFQFESKLGVRNVADLVRMAEKLNLAK